MLLREFSQICWTTFFAKHHRTTASDYNSIHSSEEKNKTLTYDTEIKHTNLSEKCNLSKRTVKSKEQVQPRTFRRCRKQSSMPLSVIMPKSIEIKYLLPQKISSSVTPTHQYHIHQHLRAKKSQHHNEKLATSR